MTRSARNSAARTSRVAVVGLVAAGVPALLVATATSASAHVSVNPDSAPAGGYSKLTFKVPNESDSDSTTKLQVFLPTDQPLEAVSVQPHAGWTYAVEKTKLAKPLTDHDGNVIEPALLVDVDPRLDVSCAELFGPAVVMTPFDSEADAIELANGTPYGLQAGVYTRDVTRAVRLAESLDFGGVAVNVPPTFRSDQMPYGGTKESGNTKEGPRWAVRELTQERLVLLGRGD